MRGVASPAASGAPAAASPLASSTPSSGPAGGLGGLFPGVGAPRSGRPSGLFGAGFPELEQVEQHLSQNPNLMREIMNMPAMQNLMNNPDLIRNMTMSNPQLRETMFHRYAIWVRRYGYADTAIRQISKNHDTPIRQIYKYKLIFSIFLNKHNRIFNKHIASSPDNAR